MPAPKGNRNAVKENPKSAIFSFKIRPENLQILRKIAKQEKISTAQVLEKALLASYPDLFSGNF